MQNEASKPADKCFSSCRMNKNLVVTHQVGSIVEQGPAGFFEKTAPALEADKGKLWEFVFRATLLIRAVLNEMGVSVRRGCRVGAEVWLRMGAESRDPMDSSRAGHPQAPAASSFL